MFTRLRRQQGMNGILTAGFVVPTSLLELMMAASAARGKHPPIQIACRSKGEHLGKQNQPASRPVVAHT